MEPQPLQWPDSFLTMCSYSTASRRLLCQTGALSSYPRSGNTSRHLSISSASYPPPNTLKQRARQKERTSILRTTSEDTSVGNKTTGLAGSPWQSLQPTPLPWPQLASHPSTRSMGMSPPWTLISFQKQTACPLTQASTMPSARRRPWQCRSRGPGWTSRRLYRHYKQGSAHGKTRNVKILRWPLGI